MPIETPVQNTVQIEAPATPPGHNPPAAVVESQGGAEGASAPKEKLPEPDMSGVNKFLTSLISKKRAAENDEDAAKAKEKADADAETSRLAEEAKRKEAEEAATVTEQVKERSKKGKRTAPAQEDRPAAPEVDYEKIAHAAGEGAGKALSRHESERAKPPEATLSDEESIKYDTFKEMEEMLPDRYKGIADKYKVALKKAQAYEADWAKNNPGKTFNPEDEEHNEFFAATDIQYNPDMFQVAAGRLGFKQQSGTLKKQIDQTAAAVDRDRRLRTEAPVMAKHALQSNEIYFKETGDKDLADLVVNGAVNTEKIAALQKSDPAKAEIFLANASDLYQESEAAYRILNGLESYDKTSPIHDAVNAAAVEVEDYMQTAPKHERMDNSGRVFVPFAEFHSMSQKEKSKHWTVTTESVLPILAFNRAQNAKKIFKIEDERLNRWAEARGLKKTNSPPVENGHAAAPVATASPARTKPKSPSADISPVSASPRNAPAASANSGHSPFLTAMLARK